MTHLNAKASAGRSYGHRPLRACRVLRMAHTETSASLWRTAIRPGSRCPGRSQKGTRGSRSESPRPCELWGSILRRRTRSSRSGRSPRCGESNCHHSQRRTLHHRRRIGLVRPRGHTLTAIISATVKDQLAGKATGPLEHLSAETDTVGRRTLPTMGYLDAVYRFGGAVCIAMGVVLPLLFAFGVLPPKD